MPAPTIPSVAARNAGSGASPVTMPSLGTDDIAVFLSENPNGANVVLSNAQAFVEFPSSPQATGVAEDVAATKLSGLWARNPSGGLVVPTIGAQVDHFCTGAFTVRGCIKTGNPWNAMAGGVQAASQVGVSVPGLTTLVNNSLVVFIFTNMFDNAADQLQSVVTPTDLVSFGRIVAPALWQTGSGNGGGIIAYAGVKKVAGPVNPLVATLANASTQGLLTIAFTPADPTDTTGTAGRVGRRWLANHSL